MKPEQSTVKHTAEVQMSANCADKIYRLLRNGLELRGLGKTAKDISLLVPSVQQIIEEEFKAFDQMLSALKASLIEHEAIHEVMLLNPQMRGTKPPAIIGIIQAAISRAEPEKAGSQP